MNVIVVRDQHRPHLGGNLNVRQLLNPLFYAPQRRHPDTKRQRKARLRARALKQARELKARAIPLRAVDPTMYPRRWNDHTERWECGPTSLYTLLMAGGGRDERFTW